MTKSISNRDDVIDSRDVIERLEELESERGDIADSVDDDATQAEKDAAAVKLTEWDEENGAELKALKALSEQASGYASDWGYGEALIRDSYFKDYAQELAEDIGAIPKDAAWPCRCIDWDEAASELLQDYTSVDFDGVTYWIR